ncbi:hypothetical protein LLH06_03880 [Mucilaginibacter daejeonensis]|uniref:hypothetical protein n=1 Tax=Mucilaginibacter daejeonensis TaxID=398049 RepID=UPI001D178072|nr:hypothetical protein [Mucilaginibacter daejeonensis]UEG54108.1 hypothetical protein LLH06_03880 [Mucilaginibacter daejeonensis]
MGGQHGMRGYLLQTLITVLESLSQTTVWESVTIEPNDESEKVDIKWLLSEGKKKLVQVKSSQNTVSYSTAKNWISELKNSAEADFYELICIAHVDRKLNEETEIDSVKIVKKPLDFDLLLSDSIVNLDRFYERNGRSKVQSLIKEILVNSLNFKLGQNSIFGRTITKTQFDEVLLNWLTAIEDQVASNPFIRFTSPEDDDSALTAAQRISINFLNLIGWGQHSKDFSLKYYDEKSLTNEVAQVDYYIKFESKLKDNTIDHIFFNTVQDFEYPEQARTQIRKFLHDSNLVTDDFKFKRKIDPQKSNSIYNMLFWISTNNNEINKDFIYQNKELFRNEYLAFDQHYFFIDNAKANFLISSIVSAKNYRENLPVKFLYPITEFNSSFHKIGKRGTQLPPEYINTNILPIIKEDKDKISVLLFCSDPYSRESLKKVVWLLIRITSGLANEYVIYFNDFSNDLKNDVSEVLHEFENEDILNKVTVKKNSIVDTTQISDALLPLTISEEIVENEQLKDTLRVNPIFREQLPYGDILKPILNTDRVTAQDLKIFLSHKGIFLKNADKKRLMDLMVSLLFSPIELENFINLINVKERPVTSTPYFLPATTKSTIAEIFDTINPNFGSVTEQLQAKLNHPVVFSADPDQPDLFVFSSYVEKKDPTKHIALNTTWEPIKISYQKIDNGLIFNNVETNSRDAKTIAYRINNIIKDELLSHGYIKDERTEIKFSDFNSNSERVNFLLSFNNIESSKIFIKQDIKGLKYLFDESKDIPEIYKDRTEKELIILFRGIKLEGLRELSEDMFKGIILLEQITISYYFDYNRVKGYFTVTYNFSDALRNKPIDGIFRSQSFLHKNYSVKQVRKISDLEKALNREVEDLKIEKLQRIGKI